MFDTLWISCPDFSLNIDSALRNRSPQSGNVASVFRTENPSCLLGQQFVCGLLWRIPARNLIIVTCPGDPARILKPPRPSVARRTAACGLQVSFKLSCRARWTAINITRHAIRESGQIGWRLMHNRTAGVTRDSESGVGLRLASHSVTQARQRVGLRVSIMHNRILFHNPISRFPSSSPPSHTPSVPGLSRVPESLPPVAAPGSVSPAVSESDDNHIRNHDSSL